MSGLFMAWLAEVGILSWRDYSQKNRAPVPSELVATFVIFGALGLVPEPYSRWASIAGWGFVVATFLNAVNPQNANGFLVGNKTAVTTAAGSNWSQISPASSGGGQNGWGPAMPPSPKNAPASQGPKFK